MYRETLETPQTVQKKIKKYTFNKLKITCVVDKCYGQSCISEHIGI